MVPPSVVVASFREPWLIERCIAALEPQCQRLGAELIVVRAETDDLSQLAQRFPSLRIIAVPPGTEVPGLRGRGLQAASGDPVALTEDHCVPAPGWLEALAARARAGADVIGGGMAHAPTGRTVDWAAYFSEYGVFSCARPRPAAGIPLVTGANVAYSRRVVGEVAEWALGGAWENVAHDRLADQGASFAFAPEARVLHDHTYAFGAFCQDRFEHGFSYARRRLAEQPRASRWLLLLATPLLPFVLFTRVQRAAAKEARGAFLKAAPLTFAFLTAWALGEAAGYDPNCRVHATK